MPGKVWTHDAMLLALAGRVSPLDGVRLDRETIKVSAEELRNVATGLRRIYPVAEDCPFDDLLGALLGAVSKFSLFRINRDVHKCTDCNMCLNRCEGAADPRKGGRPAEAWPGR